MKSLWVCLVASWASRIQSRVSNNNQLQFQLGSKQSLFIKAPVTAGVHCHNIMHFKRMFNFFVVCICKTVFWMCIRFYNFPLLESTATIKSQQLCNSKAVAEDLYSLESHPSHCVFYPSPSINSVQFPPPGLCDTGVTCVSRMLSLLSRLSRLGQQDLLITI